MADNPHPRTTRQVLALLTGANELASTWQRIKDERPNIHIVFGHHPRKNKFVYETTLDVGEIGLIIPLSNCDGSKIPKKPIFLKNPRTGLVEREINITLEDLVLDKAFDECYAECYTMLVATSGKNIALAKYGDYWAEHGDRIIAKIERGDYDNK